ncbi:hypothetical protein DFH28DRAFT_1097863 [Melampsora americana]|nr:hypothetical protein DFH28DRAFT_1097863 [Melampsora americana]
MNGSKTGNGDHNPGNNPHVSGIGSRAEDVGLYELFFKHGSKAQLMRDPNTKEIRGFGFVTLESAEEAEAAMAALNGLDFLRKVLCVEKARRGRARTPTPGQYHGPPKRDERRYDPRGYGGGPRYDDHGGGGGYDRHDRYGYAAPMRPERERYDDRRDYDRPRRDDRDYDRRY